MTPRYFVQTNDGVLHGYMDRMLLRIDISLNSFEPVKLYEQSNWGGVIRYKPIEKADLYVTKKAEECQN